MSINNSEIKPMISKLPQVEKILDELVNFFPDDFVLKRETELHKKVFGIRQKTFNLIRILYNNKDCKLFFEEWFSLEILAESQQFDRLGVSIEQLEAMLCRAEIAYLLIKKRFLMNLYFSQTNS